MGKILTCVGVSSSIISEPAHNTLTIRLHAQMSHSLLFFILGSSNMLVTQSFWAGSHHAFALIGQAWHTCVTWSRPSAILCGTRHGKRGFKS